MITSLLPVPKQQYFAIAGTPLAGGKIYTYAAGTANPKATYSDASATVAQANPIILNARGEPASAIYWSGVYKVEVRDALDNVVYTVDNYNSDKKFDTVSVFDYMTTAQIADVQARTLALDTTAAINAALATGRAVYMPEGSYKTVAPIVMNDRMKLIGAGRKLTTIVQTTAGNHAIQMTGGFYAEIRGLEITRNVAPAAAIAPAVSPCGIYCGIEVVGVLFADILVNHHYYGLLLGPTGYSTFEGSLVEHNTSHGVYITNQYATGPAQWYVTKVLSEFNGGDGFSVRTTGNNAGLSTGNFLNCQTFANSGCGFAAVGTATSAVQSVRITAGFFGGDGLGEIFLNTFGRDHRISGTFLELPGLSVNGPGGALPNTNQGNCIETTADNDTISIVDCICVSASWSGIVNLAPNTAILNTQVTNCGQAGVAGKRYGIYNNSASGVTKIVGCTSGNIGAVSQEFGISSITDNLIVNGCNLPGNTLGALVGGVPFVNSAIIGNLPNTVASVHPNSLSGFTAGGVVVGAAVSGDKGAGTINVSTNAFKNNVAFNNP